MLNNKTVKALNQSTILDIIRTEKAISKADIAALTGLSPNAVGIIAANLMNEGYICISGTGKSKGGRKPELLSLKPASYYSMGVDIDTDRIRFALIDFTGEVIYTSRLEINCVENSEKALKVINDEIKKNKKYRLLGVGFAIAGQVDAEAKTVVFAPNLKWKNVNLEKETSEDVQVFLENEAVTSAIYESWSGICQDAKNFICINSKSGIGSGIFIDGKIYKGANGSAGEVGHITVDINGPKCECGNNGCLETFSSSMRIAQKLGKNSIDEVIDMARKCDETAVQILKSSAMYIGVAVSGLVNTLNPEKIVLGKEFVKYADLIIDDIRNTVRQKSLEISSSMVEISVSREGALSSVLGAATLPLIKVFNTFPI